MALLPPCPRHPQIFRGSWSSLAGEGDMGGGNDRAQAGQLCDPWVLSPADSMRSLPPGIAGGQSRELARAPLCRCACCQPWPAPGRPLCVQASPPSWLPASASDRTQRALGFPSPQPSLTAKQLSGVLRNPAWGFLGRQEVPWGLGMVAGGIQHSGRRCPGRKGPRLVSWPSVPTSTHPWHPHLG